ncbi:hypothetical protein NVP1016O_84 [Vibrio phage 1.016.O._10N.286.46.A11]|nr:hypothetical protein NVP1016O_84 [Vibrio phage 1.016.O._10N.286.46.A11]AUR85312.1 hypothetical protein NVP1071A_82 [Vibrio phage 1.071.A._10N.286.46.A12]
MSKIKVSKLKCFGQVADIIGKAQAEIELFKVISVGDECGFEDYPVFDGAFIFNDTPQGSDFWHSIQDGINPYDN